ncbi:hypothetical protein ACOME3_009481 [Neoechinorhynchus agilis]
MSSSRRFSEPPIPDNFSPIAIGARTCYCQKEHVFSHKLGLKFTIFVQNEVQVQSRGCCIMTIHDVGTTHAEFHNFVNDSTTVHLRNRIVWLHVELPGQEDNAPDLNISKYPSLDDLARELVVILEAAKVPHPVIMGEGIGANIAARFAMLYPTSCLGLILIKPTATAAGLKEAFLDKIYQWRLSNKGMVPQAATYLSWNTFGEAHEKMKGKDKPRRNTTPAEDAIQRFRDDLAHKRNPKNLALFFGAIKNRTDITDKMHLIKCDVLVVCGRQTAVLHTTEKFFEKFKESRQEQDNTVRMFENSTLIVFDDVSNVLIEASDRLAHAVQYFLQGIGLISGVPLVKGLEGLGRRHRTFSMAQADEPVLPQSRK